MQSCCLFVVKVYLATHIVIGRVFVHLTMDGSGIVRRGAEIACELGPRASVI